MPPEEMINIFSPQQELNLPIHFPDLDFLMEEDPEDLDELDYFLEQYPGEIEEEEDYDPELFLENYFL